MKNKVCAKGVKKMSFKKYAEGTNGIFSKLKAKQDAQDSEAAAIDAEDAASTSATSKKVGLFGKLKARQKESDFNAGVIDSFDSELKNAKPSSENPELAPATGQGSRNEISKLSYRNSEDSSKPNIPTTVSPIATSTKIKGSDDKLAAWQRKRGLKDDGIWGAESKAAYAKEQSAKLNKNFQKPINDNRKFEGQLHNTYGNEKPSNTDFYKNKQHQAIMESSRGQDRSIGTDSNGQSYPTVKGTSYAKKPEVKQPWYNMTYDIPKNDKHVSVTKGYVSPENQEKARVQKTLSTNPIDFSKTGTAPKGSQLGYKPMQGIGEGLKTAKAKTPRRVGILGTYADGTSSIDVEKKKKMDFVGPRSAELEGRDAEANYDREQKTIKARTEGEAARTAQEAGKPSSSLTKSIPAGKTEGVDWNNKAEMAKVKAYQQRHGLKDDGIWGKDTKKFYEDSLKSKSSSSTRGQAVVSKTKTTTPTATSTTTKVNTPTGKGLSYSEVLADDGTVRRKASNGDVFYENGRVKRANGKMENAKGNELSQAKRTYNNKASGSTLGKYINSDNKTRNREDSYLDDAVDIGSRVIGGVAGAAGGTFLGGPAGSVAGGMAGDALGKKIGSKINNALGFEKENGKYTLGDAVENLAFHGAGKVVSKVGGKVLSKVAPKLLGGTESAAGKILSKYSSGYAKAAAPKTAEELAEAAGKKGVGKRMADVVTNATKKVFKKGEDKAIVTSTKAVQGGGGTAASLGKATAKAEAGAAEKAIATEAKEATKEAAKTPKTSTTPKVKKTYGEEPVGTDGHKKVYLDKGKNMIEHQHANGTKMNQSEVEKLYKKIDTDAAKAKIVNGEGEAVSVLSDTPKVGKTSGADKKAAKEVAEKSAKSGGSVATKTETKVYNGYSKDSTPKVEVTKGESMADKKRAAVKKALSNSK